MRRMLILCSKCRKIFRDSDNPEAYPEHPIDLGTPCKYCGGEKVLWSEVTDD